MEKLLKINEAANYLNVSIDTLRKWDNNGKLKSIKTVGGHRRYDKDLLDEFLGKSNYGKLYEHLCSAQYIAHEINDDQVEAIEKIRINIGDKLLRRHNIIGNGER